MLKLFNLKKYKDLIGKSDFDFFDDEHAKPAYNDEQRVIKTGKPIIDLVEKEVKKDGTVSWVSTSKMPLKDKDGKIVGIFGISKDITASKKLEEETHAANEKLEFEKIMFTALMDNISARITYKDTEGRHLRINKTKSKALGLKDPSEIFGKTDPEVFGSTHTIERLKKEIQQIKKGISSQNEELFRQKDGSAHWGDTNRIPLRNKNGEIVGGLVITWDITKRKNMQFQLEELTDLLKDLSKNLPVVVFDADKSGAVKKINGEGLKLLKLKDQKIAIGKLFTLFPEIKKSMSDKNEKDTIASSGKVKIDRTELHYKYLLIRSKSTVGGYSGYIIVENY
jgi:PAS domain S-box-containing protein